MKFADFPFLVEFLGDVNGEPRPITINANQVIAVYPLGTTADKTGVDVVGGHIRLNEKYIDVKKALIGDPTSKKPGRK